MLEKKRMRVYRKKTMIEAVQITEELNLSDYFGPEYFGKMQWTRNRGTPYVEIHTLEGLMIGNMGDWIARGVEGELYPIKNSVFQATYEEVRPEWTGLEQ